MLLWFVKQLEGFWERTVTLDECLEKKPFISENNRKKRLEFAQKYVYGPAKLIFERIKYLVMRTNVISSAVTESKQFSANLILTVKYGGGSVLIWVWILANGFGKLQFVETNMDRYIYLNIILIIF